MSILMIIKGIIALATAATGILGLVKPTAIYGFTGLKADGERGISEIRAIFGGLFIGLGLAPFFLGGVAYQTVGMAYLTIAVARLVSIFLDRSTAQSNLISLGIEIVFGVVLVI